MASHAHAIQARPSQTDRRGVSLRANIDPFERVGDLLVTQLATHPRWCLCSEISLVSAEVPSWLLLFKEAQSFDRNRREPVRARRARVSALDAFHARPGEKHVACPVRSTLRPACPAASPRQRRRDGLGSSWVIVRMVQVGRVLVGVLSGSVVVGMRMLALDHRLMHVVVMPIVMSM